MIFTFGDGTAMASGRFPLFNFSGAFNSAPPDNPGTPSGEDLNTSLYRMVIEMVQ